MAQNGLNVIVVKKSDLLGALKKNRDVHRSIFLEAQVGYREAVIKELDSMLADARSGRAYRKVVRLEEPQDHTRDYDRIVKMLEMSIADDVPISETEFAQYVLDDWGWKDQFIGTASSYTNNR